jgi:hypothetical protein
MGLSSWIDNLMALRSVWSDGNTMGVACVATPVVAPAAAVDADATTVDCGTGADAGGATDVVVVVGRDAAGAGADVVAGRRRLEVEAAAVDEDTTSSDMMCVLQKKGETKKKKKKKDLLCYNECCMFVSIYFFRMK